MHLLSRELVMEKLKEMQDPELRMSIVDLGLIYDVTIEEGRVHVLYTLTSPGCPLAPVIRGQIEHALMDIPGVKQVDAQLTFSPPWDPRTMASEDVKMQLGIW
ncbi:MAG: metal-sulfur cluster assembly factor [Dehalococcoidia bacterium]